MTIIPTLDETMGDDRDNMWEIYTVCFWPGCEADVPPKMHGCRKHWSALPERLRKKVLLARLHEAADEPGDQYHEAVREVWEWTQLHQS